MNIKELRAKIETEPKISLGKVYDEIMYTDMFVIKSKLEKYCPDVQLKNTIHYSSKLLVDAENDIYRVNFVVVYSVALNDEIKREFAIARNFDHCFINGVRGQTIIYKNDDENTKSQKYSAQLDIALKQKEHELKIETMDDDYLRQIDMPLWKDHIPYFSTQILDKNDGNNTFQPIYITKCGDAHKLCINLPKMNKILWEIVEDNVEILKLKRAGEITEYIKNKHQAIDRKREEIKEMNEEIEDAYKRKDEIISSWGDENIDLILTRKK